MTERVLRHYDALRRRKTATLIRWWHALDIYDRVPELDTLTVRAIPAGEDDWEFRVAVMHEIQKELGRRVIADRL